MQKYHVETLAIHAGQHPDPSTGAVMTPIYQTSTFAQAAPGVHKGYEYARVHNPTRTALEENLAALEGASTGIAFSSGVAATDAIMRSLRPGDHIIATSDLYGGTYRLFTQTFERFGLSFSFVDMRDISQIEAALTPKTRIIWVETPTNPLIRILDIKAIASIGTQNEIAVVVDNTFASPYLQQPLAMGATMVLHSTTKYLGGHSDVIGGAICTSDATWIERLRFQVKAAGAVPGPMDCFLTLRGIKTLHVRMERHGQNALQIATFLRDHPNVGMVYYPGLPSHEGHELAKKQMKNYGGMLSFMLKNNSLENAIKFMSATRLFTLAESLGGVESLVNHPATMTHASIPAEIRHAAGLHDSLIRLSVGIEHVEDLIADLASALSGV
ncbi:MAG: cystathionine gamma-synthase [Bacteroidetes Order II. Incertae sedis bacterium]|nr:cystathionine gamma-synthase [Bacteroidetes Order II. bacterium]